MAIKVDYYVAAEKTKEALYMHWCRMMIEIHANSKFKMLSSLNNRASSV